jgi:DNA mismatch repair protein MutS2
VLLSLTRRGAITMATTHLGALKQLASKSPGVVNASLQFDAATLRPSYRFLKGVPGRSYGLAIARRLGLPEEVLVEAEAQVPDAERSLDALLAAIETREREQARREAELAEQLAETTALRARLDAANTMQEARELELQRRERDAQRAAKEQTRSFLLQARTLVEDAIAKARDAGDESRAREARRMVEEAIQAESRESEAPILPSHGPAGYEVGSLAVGDRVALDTGAPGEVLELRSDGKAVVRVGAVKLVVERSTLRPGGAAPTRSQPQRSDPSPVAATLSLTEIDLRGMTGDEAEMTVLSAIDAAVLAENPVLRIIHGKGTGVVRERVQRVISRDRRVRSHAFAPANQGGTGVTVVELEG